MMQANENRISRGKPIGQASAMGIVRAGQDADDCWTVR